MPKSIGTVRGSNRVPNASPSAPHMKHASGVSVSSTGQLMWRCTGVAGTIAAIGNTSSALTAPLSAPAVTFSIATRSTGIGARTRSSISRVYPNSCTIGSATDWMPWKMIASPTTPATSAVENSAAPRARAADALADLREDVREHEDEQQRLEQGAGQELLDVLAQHDEVAEQQRAERDPRRRARGERAGTSVARRGRRRRRGGRVVAHSRSSLPVRLMKTVSSVGAVAERSWTSLPRGLGDVDDARAASRRSRAHQSRISAVGDLDARHARRSARGARSRVARGRPSACTVIMASIADRALERLRRVDGEHAGRGR